MLAILKWIATTLGFSALLIFCIFNRGDVALTLNPFGAAMVLPLALVILGGVVVGFIWGAVIVWIHGGVIRRALKDAQKETKALEQRLVLTQNP